jgi:hypothetical protein
MKLSPGAKLKSAVSPAQVVVVRPPKEAGVLACGGTPMIGFNEEAAGAAADLSGDGVQTGKRYFDEDSGLEVLGVKAGAGQLSFAGRELKLKEAKKLPASD